MLFALALVLAAEPPLSDNPSTENARWSNCAYEVALRYVRSRESADTVARVALHDCKLYETRYNLTLVHCCWRSEAEFEKDKREAREEIFSDVLAHVVHVRAEAPHP